MGEIKDKNKQLLNKFFHYLFDEIAMRATEALMYKIY